MSRKTPPRKAEPQTCAYCGRDIPVADPTYLVGEATGRILGPFHPSCAQTVIERGRKLAPDAKLPGMDFGRVVEGVEQKPLL